MVFLLGWWDIMLFFVSLSQHGVSFGPVGQHDVSLFPEETTSCFFWERNNSLFLLLADFAFLAVWDPRFIALEVH